jgi:ankyrin repeat protein
VVPDDELDARMLAAAAAGDVEGIASAIADGADPDARNASGTPAVMLATYGRHVAALRALLDAGANVDAQDADLDDPFLYAGREGLLDILVVANEAEADPTVTNRYGGVALIPASERGHVEIVRYLLNETDIDVDHVNNLGWTALLEAVILGDGGLAHQEIVRLLVAAGARTDLADRDGVTPLEHARSRGYDEIAALLG